MDDKIRRMIDRMKEINNQSKADFEYLGWSMMEIAKMHGGTCGALDNQYFERLATVEDKLLLEDNTLIDRFTDDVELEDGTIMEWTE